MPLTTGAEPVSRTLLRDDVHTRLRDAIVDGTLAPGEQLRDLDLATWLGVSRTPVREALLRLAQAGLVRAEPGRSTVVSPLDLGAVRDAQAVVAAMHRLAVQEAVPVLTAEDFAQMRAANARFAAALAEGSVIDALAADDDFHAIPVRASANGALASVLAQYQPVIRRLERLRFESIAASTSVTMHSRLVDLCEARDVKRAAQVSYQTWQTLEPLLAGLADARQHRPTSTKGS